MHKCIRSTSPPLTSNVLGNDGREIARARELYTSLRICTQTNGTSTNTRSQAWNVIQRCFSIIIPSFTRSLVSCLFSFRFISPLIVTKLFNRDGRKKNNKRRKTIMSMRRRCALMLMSASCDGDQQTKQNETNTQIKSFSEVYLWSFGHDVCVCAHTRELHDAATRPRIILDRTSSKDRLKREVKRPRAFISLFISTKNKNHLPLP